MTRSASHSRQLSYACGEDDQSGITELPAERIFFVQLADAPRLAMDPLSWSRHTRNSPGQGQLPVADFLRAVFAAGYRGPLSLEVFSDEFRAASARHHEADGVTPADHVRYRDVAHRGDAEGGGPAALREEFGHQIAHGVIAR